MTTTLPAPEQSPEAPAKTVRKLPLRPLLAIAAALAAATYGWIQFGPKAPPDHLELTGRIEADETDVGAKTGGRILAISVREGDSVQAGQVIAELADEEVPQQLQAAAAQVAAAQQELQQAKLDIAVAESRIQEASANLQQAKGDSSGRITQAQATVSSTREKLAEAQAQLGQAQAQRRQAEAQVEQARAQVRQAQASLKLAQTNRDRMAQLLRQGAIAQQQFDQAQTTVETSQAAVDTAQASVSTAIAGVATAQSTETARAAAIQSAQDQLAASQGGLTQTQTTALNPTIRNSQLDALRQQKQQAYARLAAAEAKVKNLQALQNQIQKRIDSFQIKSPIDGVVQDRPLEPGAVVATGKTLLTLLNPKTVYLRGYIPEGDLGHIKVGMAAQVFLDSNPQQPLAARVSAIDPKASFTPENIYFKKDRVRQVFGVKLAIEEKPEFAKPGMPADARILLK